MKTKKPEPTGKITTIFYFGGQSFPLDGFSRAAGRDPTKVWHQKNATLIGNPNFTQVSWDYVIEKQPCWSVDEAIVAMLDLFEARRKKIVDFSKRHECSLHLCCRIYGDSTKIIYQIERSTIKRLAAFGFEFSFTIEPR
jgi:hypothetical protein